VFFDRSRGLWVAEVTLGVGSDGKRRRRRVASRDKAEVVRRLAVLRAAAAKGDDAERTSTEAWLIAWLTELAPARRSANTIANYRWAFEKWVIPNVGRIPLSDLGPGDLERVWRLMEANGHSANTIRAARPAVSAALSEARRRGLVDRHAAQLSEVPHTAPKTSSRRRSAQRKIQSLTPEEADRLVAKAQELGHPYEAMIRLGLARGLRPGELTGLTWEDVDLEERTVFVRRARIDENGTLRHGKPKTKRSERLLRVPPEVTDALRRRRAQWEEERAKAGRAWQDLDLVFCTRSGGFIDRSNLRRHFERLGKQAGIEGLTPYLLRHSATSILAEEGVPPEGLAEMLGHANTRMVEQHYRHRITPAIDVDRWRRTVGPIVGGGTVPGGGDRVGPDGDGGGRARRAGGTRGARGASRPAGAKGQAALRPAARSGATATRSGSGRRRA
jgi:integrase